MGRYLGVSGREVEGEYERDGFYKELVGGKIIKWDSQISFTVEKNGKLYECSIDSDCYTEVQIFRIDKVIKLGRD